MNRTRRLVPVESFVAVFDILGFSEMVKNREITRVTETYMRMLREFRGILRATGTLLPDKDAISFRSFSRVDLGSNLYS